MNEISIAVRGVVLRDFSEADREAFVQYQMDPRYLALYDLDQSNRELARELFDSFIAWQNEAPRTRFQFGIFDLRDDALCGCAGLRGTAEGKAIAGIELAPAQWGRFGLALDVSSALLTFGFDTLKLQRVVGSTASGNDRVTKLARWFGAREGTVGEGSAWMRARGWREVEWVIDRADWLASAWHRRGRPADV